MISINVDFWGHTTISKEYNINTTLGKLLLDALENNMANEEILIFIPSKFELQLIKANYNELEKFDITDEELAQAKKDAYNDALDKIEYHSGEPTFDDGWSAAIDYIRKKFIRPQNKWKPSDGQIEALERMLNFANFDEVNNRDIVRNLLSQLKKLREE